MELWSLLGIAIIVVLLLTFKHVFSVVVKLLFYSLLAALVLVFVFGVSFSDIWFWTFGWF